MKEPPLADLVIREPLPTELTRAVYLFRQVRLRRQAQIFVATRSRPVERFVAAVAWWPAETTACFQLACQPGISRAEVCGRLIERVAEQARTAGLATIQYGDLLEENSEWIALLQELGFRLLRSERFFAVAVQESWTRTMETFRKFQSKIPSTWRTEPIRRHPPESILGLIAPYRLMPPEELRDYWRPEAAGGFDLDLSSILFDGEEAIGTLLVRRAQESLYVDIRVVGLENQLWRALGNVLLFRHMARQRDQNQSIRWLQFRGGATEHRETANLARRMEGREMPPRHVYSRTL